MLTCVTAYQVQACGKPCGKPT